LTAELDLRGLERCLPPHCPLACKRFHGGVLFLLLRGELCRPIFGASARQYVCEPGGVPAAQACTSARVAAREPRCEPLSSGHRLNSHLPLPFTIPI
jgi:hypothetical protein